MSKKVLIVGSGDTGHRSTVISASIIHAMKSDRSFKDIFLSDQIDEPVEPGIKNVVLFDDASKFAIKNYIVPSFPLNRKDRRKNDRKNNNKRK